MSPDFTLDGYRDLLGALLDRGYQARGFGEAEPDQRHLILRHDIDMSLDAAEPIADIESNLGLRAYYFVLVRSEMYNPFSAGAEAVFKRLTARGHEIGLHLDASLYGNDTAMLQGAAERECALLEAATSAPVRVISFHRPAKTLLGYADPLAGRLHAYQPRFFSQMGYCSDSRGEWGHGHPLGHPALADGRALQLLTHPVWWTAEGKSPADKLADFIGRRIDALDRALADNSSIYRCGDAWKWLATARHAVGKRP